MCINSIGSKQLTVYPEHLRSEGVNNKPHSLCAQECDVFQKSSKPQEEKRAVIRKIHLTEDKATLIKHEKYAKLAQDACHDVSKLRKSDDFKRVDIIQNKESGFSSSIYQNPQTNEVVIAYRCTSNKPGVESDIQMVQRQIPNQYEDAEEVYDKIKEEYPDAEVTVIGYSLGGSLAQLLASANKEVKAITFNAFGTSQIIKTEGLKDNKNCINYTVSSDIVSNSTPHPGTTRTIFIGPPRLNMKKPHSMSHFKNLRRAVYVNPKMADLNREVTAKKLTNPLGDFSRKNPELTKKVPDLFFEDEEFEPLSA